MKEQKEKQINAFLQKKETFWRFSHLTWKRKHLFMRLINPTGTVGLRKEDLGQSRQRTLTGRLSEVCSSAAASSLPPTHTPLPP